MMTPKVSGRVEVFWVLSTLYSQERCSDFELNSDSRRHYMLDMFYEFRCDGRFPENRSSNVIRVLRYLLENWSANLLRPCYQNIRSALFGFVTKHACDRRTDRWTDRENHDSRQLIPR